MDEIVGLSVIAWPEVVLRFGLAAAFALVLGLDRDRKNKPSDFRAYMIVTVATCAMAILGQELYADYASADGVVSLDLSKIIAGVLTGIGFLGAGAIIKRDDGDVIGVATGASIWAAGGIGLTIGFGFYLLGFILFAFVALILIAGGFFTPAAQGKTDMEAD